MRKKQAKPTLYRAKLTTEHFNMARQYMVDKDMGSASEATEEMIEIAAAASEAAAAVDHENGAQGGSPVAIAPAVDTAATRRKGLSEDR